MSGEGMNLHSIEYHFGAGITPTLVFAWIVWGILIALSIWVARRAKLVPSSPQVVFETFIEFVTGMADELIGPRAKQFYPLFLGLFFFILAGNLIGFIPGMVSPTSDPNLTFGLALLVFVYFIALGFKCNGLRYLKQFAPPKLPWYLLPIGLLLSLTEVLSFFIRPLSLGLRLFCNIFSKELFLGILAWLMLDFFLKFLVGHGMTDILFTGALLVMRPAIMLMGLIIAFIQALVFMILSMTYIAGAVHMEEH